MANEISGLVTILYNNFPISLLYTLGSFGKLSVLPFSLTSSNSLVVNYKYGSSGVVAGFAAPTSEMISKV